MIPPKSVLHHWDLFTVQLVDSLISQPTVSLVPYTFEQRVSVVLGTVWPSLGFAGSS